MLAAAEIAKLKGRPRLRVWMIALLSGLLIMTCQPPLNVPLAALFGFVPLFIALPRLSAAGSWLAGFGVAFVYFGVNQWWLGQMVTDPGNEQIVFGMYVFVTAYMSAFWATAALVSRWLLTRRASWPALFVPLAWLALEFIHEFNVPGPYPWLPLGAAITELDLFIQTADIWGQYGLTFTVVLVNLAIARGFELSGEAAKFGRRRQRVWLPASVLLLLVAGTIYGAVRVGQISARETGQGPLIGLVQGNLAQEVKVRSQNARQRILDSYTEHMALTRQAAEGGADMVCWAETMLFGGATREGFGRLNPQASERFFDDGVPHKALLDGSARLPDGRRHGVAFVENLRASIAHELHTPMLVGVLTDIPQSERDVDWKQESYDRRAYNSAMLFDARGRVAGSYDKRNLVPGGEYIPLEDQAWARAIVESYAEGLQGYTSRVEQGRRDTLFRLTARDGHEFGFTSTICYEFAFPGTLRQQNLAAERYPDFHVNLSNEGWFKESAELDQAVDFCRLRAIESRVPMVRATNTGITCHIDALGRVREVLTVEGKDREVQGLLLVRPAVLSDPGPTLFVSIIGRGLGHLALVCTAAIMVLMIAGRLAARRKRVKAA